MKQMNRISVIKMNDATRLIAIEMLKECLIVDGLLSPFTIQTMFSTLSEKRIHVSKLVCSLTTKYSINASVTKIPIF